MKKISVIISVYNCEEYLEECLDSIERQTLPKKDIEVIIINDGSTDLSSNIIKRYIKGNNDWLFIDRENRGLSASRNEGLDICTGKYVTFFDSDDILEVDALENMYNELEKNNCDIGLFRTKSFNSEGVYDDNYIDKFNSLESITNLSENLELSKFIRSVAILYKTKLLKNIRFITGVVHEDNYFCIKAYSEAKKIFVSKTYVYRIRKREGNNLSITQKLNFNTFKDLLINLLKADKEIKNKYIVKIHMNQLFGYICKNVPNKNIEEAILLIKDYLYDMYKNDSIGLNYYLYLRLYLQIKYMIRLYKTLFFKKLKLFYLSLLTIISPALNTKIFYKKRIGKKINLKNPKTFNEKIQWLKLNYLYPNKLVTRCADKVEVRNYIKEKGCEEILVDVIGIYNDVDKINFDQLPNKFALKWNFGCGYNIICTDKNKLNERVAKKVLKKWGHSKFHLHNSELHYKNIKRKVICEKFIESESGILPEDYKFYCFNGKAEYVMICYEREKGEPKFYFFDRKWNLAKLNKRSNNLSNDFKIKKPKMIDKMFDYADKLSSEFPFVRVDLYTSKDKIYFGELTFTPSAGLDMGYTEEGSQILASKIKVLEVKK